MMDKETLQVLVGHFIELKVKIRDVTTGHEEPVDARTRCTGNESVGNKASQVIPSKFDGLRAPTAELEAAMGEKAEATTEAPKEEESEAEGQRRASCRRVLIVAAAAPDGRLRAALRREQLASDRVKALQDRLANSAGFSEGDHLWPYRPTPKRGKTTKLQSSWEGPYRSSPGSTT
jgi:hypothetical protein